jgi:UDP-N-acetylmuramate dehydrogenase
MSSRGQQLLSRLGRFDLPPGALELRPDELMARHTTLRLGGPADLWARPVDAAALQQLLVRCHALDVPVTFVGGGSNLLVRDGGLRGVVINLGRMNRVVRPDDHDPTRVDVEAGAATGRLLRTCSPCPVVTDGG